MTIEATSNIGKRDDVQQLANRIMDYWARRGYAVNAEVVPFRGTAQGDGEDIKMFGGYVVRSDMVNGWPAELLARRINDAKAGMKLL